MEEPGGAGGTRRGGGASGAEMANARPGAGMPCSRGGWCAQEADQTGEKGVQRWLFGSHPSSMPEDTATQKLQERLRI